MRDPSAGGYVRANKVGNFVASFLTAPPEPTRVAVSLVKPRAVRSAGVPLRTLRTAAAPRWPAMRSTCRQGLAAFRGTRISACGGGDTHGPWPVPPLSTGPGGTHRVT